MLEWANQASNWGPLFMDITLGLVAFLLMSGGQPAPAMIPPVDASIPAMEREAPKVAVEKSEEQASYTVKLTAYNAVPEQTDHNPLITASGASSNPEVVVARSHDLADELPFGTVIAIERPAYQHPSKCGFDAVEHLIGYRVVADTTHSRKQNQIDVLFNSLDTVPVHGREINPSIALGICDDVVIRVVGKIALSDIPQTQSELAIIMDGTKLVLAK